MEMNHSYEHQASSDTSPTPPVVRVPDYDTVISQLDRLLISNIWQDDEVNPERVFRPAFRRINGPGSDLLMPLAASWLSSGPDKETSDESNIVVLPYEVDRTFLDHMRSLGVLGKHAYLRDFHLFPKLATDTRRRIYNVDDLPDEWDDISINRASTVRLINTKKYLRDLSEYAAPYELVDLRTTTAEDFTQIAGDHGVLYVKKNNTENTSGGVLICRSAAEYVDVVRDLRAEAEQFQLDFEIVLQKRIDGKNRSYQFLMSPQHPSELQLIAHSYQIIAHDGKSYLGNENPPLNAESVTPVLTHMVVDMAQKIRAIDPQTFGFVMCDYFETENGPLTFDPGLRPSGNTATTLARLFAERYAGDGQSRQSETFFVARDAEPMSFKNFIRPIDALMDPKIVEEGKPCVVPWGFNHLQGRGMFIAIGRTRDEMQSVLQDAQGLLQSSR